jgi:hypothetical protein
MLIIVPDQDEADTEVIYRWTIRALYALAIGLNVYMLVDQMKDSPEWQVTQAKATRWIQRRLEPLRARQMFTRHANAVIYEATEIVESA